MTKSLLFMLLGYQAVVIDILLGYYNKAVEVERVVPVDDEDDVPALISTAKLAFGNKEQYVEGSGEGRDDASDVY